ncbi:MAG: type II secretion system protein [Candidatus Paceibacteria bacterium]
MSFYTEEDGFTLIELLVVIAIIGLLSTLAVIALGSAREEARDQNRLSDLKQIQTSLEIYFTENNQYPVAEEGVVLGGNSAKCLDSEEGFASSGCGDALSNIPSDPGENRYIYSSQNGDTYQIQARLEGKTGGFGPGPIIVTPSGIQNAQQQQ